MRAQDAKFKLEMLKYEPNESTPDISLYLEKSRELPMTHIYSVNIRITDDYTVGM